MKDQASVTAILTRIFKGGPLRRLPKKQDEGAVVLALSVAELDSERFYDETEINRHLTAWLSHISAEDSKLDYVTLRRYLIDYRFLRRAADGVVYRLVPETVAGVLTDEASTVDALDVYLAVEAERAERRDTHRQSD